MSVTPNDYSKARAELARLLHYDLGCLSPEQSLRLDCACALRLALDDLQGRIVRGESIDTAKMLSTAEALAKLLPATALATPPPDESHHQDPRRVMFEIYMKMRRNGEINLRSPDEGPLQSKIAELEAEVAALKAGSAPALLDGSSAITPRESDITPPSELGVCHVGVKPGPDDPKPPVTIEAHAVRPKPPAASAAPPSRPQIWDDTDSGKAWNAWRDAGGLVGGDPWANNNR
jgi:hypothetical protein